MTTLALIIEYDGTMFSGWQIQPNANTIQNEIQKAYYNLTNENLNLVGSGRTDAGVHAKGQVASAKIDKIIIPDEKISLALNSVLPKEVRILKGKYFNFAFNARFDAINREYEYLLSKKVSVFERNFVSEIKLPFNELKLNEAAKLFLGENDFTTFSKVNDDIKNNNCKVTKSEWEIDNNGICKFTVKSNHFLYGMVRAIVGAMLEYARGKCSLNEISFALKMKDRSLAYPFASPTGLYLTKVNYSTIIQKELY